MPYHIQKSRRRQVGKSNLPGCSMHRRFPRVCLRAVRPGRNIRRTVSQTEIYEGRYIICLFFCFSDDILKINGCFSPNSVAQPCLFCLGQTLLNFTLECFYANKLILFWFILYYLYCPFFKILDALFDICYIFRTYIHDIKSAIIFISCYCYWQKVYRGFMYGYNII
jgi:hypothetical protein